MPKDRKAWSPELGGPALPETGGGHWRDWRTLLREEAGPKPYMARERAEVMLQPATYGAMMENAHNGARACPTKQSLFRHHPGYPPALLQALLAQPLL